MAVGFNVPIFCYAWSRKWSVSASIELATVSMRYSSLQV